MGQEKTKKFFKMLDFPCIWRYFKRNKADFPVYNIKGVKKIKILFFCFTLIQLFNKMSQNILKLALRRNIMNTVLSGGGSLRILPIIRSISALKDPDPHMLKAEQYFL